MRATRFSSFAFVVLIGMAQAWSQGVGAGVVPGVANAASSTSSACDAILHGKTVPFSAEVTESTDQQLADGTKIHRETRGRIFRDSAGRSRTETEVLGRHSEIPVNFVTIQDPVKRVFVSLDPAGRTATIRHSFVPETRRSVPLPVDICQFTRPDQVWGPGKQGN